MHRFQIRSGPQFRHFSVDFTGSLEGGRVGPGRVGGLLFRTHSQQRARASRGQKLENFANFANPNPHPSSQPRDAQAADQQVLPARTLELVLREGFTKPGRSFEE